MELHCDLIVIAFCRNTNTGRRRTQISFVDRTLAAAASRLWNSLPSDIRQPDLSYGQFGSWRSLKTFLFWVVGLRCSATCVNCALETLTYLLIRQMEESTKCFFVWKAI